MIHIIGCAQGIISSHLVSTTWWVAPSISRWVWYCNHKHMSWFGWELVSTADLLQLGVVAPSVTRLTLWWNHKRWLIVLHDKMTMAMRGCYQWQCMEVMNQSNWSPTWAEAQLKQIPLEISELLQGPQVDIWVLHGKVSYLEFSYFFTRSRFLLDFI